MKSGFVPIFPGFLLAMAKKSCKGVLVSNRALCEVSFYVHYLGIEWLIAGIYWLEQRPPY